LSLRDRGGVTRGVSPGRSRTGARRQPATRAHGYDAYLRRTSFTALTNGTAFVGDSFSYDSASRLQTVTDNGSGNSATYSHLAKSPLVGQIAFANGGQTRMTTTKQYDYLNRLTATSSVPSAAAVVSFAYQHNSANQRTAVTGNDGSYWTHGYDPLGQVTNGVKRWGDNSLVAGDQFQYAFDPIGNRLSTDAGGDQNGNNLRHATYSANNLNQYAARTVPGYAELSGSAAANAKVAILSGRGAWVAAYRKTNYFWGELSLNNAVGPVWATVTNVAVVTNGSSPADASSAVGRVFIPQTPEAFTYDADGNLLTDGRWSYTWDAENRLIGMTNNTSAAPPQGLAFGYDWQGRRIQKQVWCGGLLTNNTSFLADAWNLVGRLNATNSAAVQTYLWGVDLSGTPQGAGGVGGLLEVWDGSNGAHYCAFDANGNVAGLVTATSAANSAQYEYGPFGELLRASGPMAKAQPFRFATKYQDDETDLLYYGCRYFDSASGRWLSRDPLEEDGGVALYSLCENDVLGGWDVLGLTGNGHHIFPKAVSKGMNEAVRDFFDNDLNRIFNEYYKTHNAREMANISAKRYNKIMTAELKRFLGRDTINDLTLSEAKSFMEHLQTLPPTNPINLYNKAVAEEAYGAMKRALAAQAEKAAASSLAAAEAAGARKAESKALGKAIPVVGTFVAIYCIWQDSRDYGLGPALVNSGVDAIPLIGTAVVGSEIVAGGRWLDVFVGPKEVRPTSVVCSGSE